MEAILSYLGRSMFLRFNLPYSLQILNNELRSQPGNSRGNQNGVNSVF